MVIIFTGKGKGKTSAAITTALRSIYHRKKVVIIQCFKKGNSGEIRLLQYLIKLKINPFKSLKIFSFGSKSFINPRKIRKQDLELVNKCLKKIKESLTEKPFLLILDEINIALKFKLILEDDLLDIMRKCKRLDTHLILTGRGATQKVIDSADLVSDIKEIKHPYNNGTEAVKGIDY